MNILVLETPNSDYSSLFREFGTVHHNPVKVHLMDLVVFTGGSDVSPSWYGEQAHPATHTNKERDVYERHVFNAANALNIPMAGICRGAQLLCVFSGGRLIQHVTGHCGAHNVNTSDGGVVGVNSTHHQMMYPWHTQHDLLAWSEGISITYEDEHQVRPFLPETAMVGNVVKEPEVVWFPQTMSLAAQYHPESMNKDSEGRLYYKSLVERYLLK